MAIIDIKNLSFTHVGALEAIFSDVNLNLDSDWKLGLIGRNGYGKSTFLSLLLNKFPYQGNIYSSIDFTYFPFTIPNKDLLTLSIVEQLKTNFELWQLKKELNFLEVKENVLSRPFSSLSQGEQTKILLASMFMSNDQFFLIDEPTNHLDRLGRKLLAKYLASKKGFILVSHDRNFLNESIDHLLAIEKNKIVLLKGNYDTWERNKQLEDKFELEENAKLRKEIRRLKTSSRVKGLWAQKIEKTKIGQSPCDRGYIGHQAAKMMKRAKVIKGRMEKNIEDKTELLKNIETIEDLKITPLGHHSEVFLEAKNFTISYSRQPIFTPLDFVVNQGDCLVIEGGNGSGKSSILKTIIGENVKYKGNLEQASKLIISYVPQSFDFLKGSLEEFIDKYQLDKTLFLSILRKLGFSREQFSIPLENFSNGQKKKALLAKSLCEKAHLYIWDEPLNYIDIISRIQLENMILRYAPSMIIVEHDVRFCEKIATDFITLSL